MESVKAIVQEVIRDGNHGPFAVAKSGQLEGSVTFSLEPTVWQEQEWPERGMSVYLEELRQKRAGWRAKKGRFWRLSDEQSARSNTMQFLYPVSRQFPFDEVCEQIVRELEKRNWQVPGINVEFHEYGSGAQKFRLVSKIQGRDFRLRFHRCQFSISGGPWNDTAGISKINIPKMQLHVYEDESGPTFFLYVGNDYRQDRENFVNHPKLHSKLDGEPRMYLRYEGGCCCKNIPGAGFSADRVIMSILGKTTGGLSHLVHTHKGQRSPLLVQNNDMKREYDAEGDEPRFFLTDMMMDVFRQYLEADVLTMITSQPIPAERFDSCTTPEPVPIPDFAGTLFCFGSYRDAERIKQGKEDPEKLQPADRYGMQAEGNRLLHWGIPNDGTVPEVANEGFLWCGNGEVTTETAIESLSIPGHHRWADSERFVIRLKPNRANDIFIADHFQYEKRRKELGDAIETGRDRFTEDEVADFMRARARTIIPITEYKGGYEQPVILINRDLDLDEVEVVSGPHKDSFGNIS